MPDGPLMSMVKWLGLDDPSKLLPVPLPETAPPLTGWRGTVDQGISGVVGGLKGVTGIGDQGPAGPTWTNAGAVLGAAMPFVGTEKAAEALATKFPKFAAAIKAYHGSPHDFEAFDTTKIGTGEGAQAYGHGLYFAEKEKTAEAYRDALSDVGLKITRGPNAGKMIKPVPGSPESIAEAHLQDAVTAMYPYDKARKTLDDMVKMDWSPENKLRFQQARKAIDTWEQQGVSLDQTAGKMYEVNINAHPDQFLDWDKPLSQQPEAVRYVFGHQPAPTQAETDAVFALAKQRGVNPASMPEYKALQVRLDAAAKLDRDYPNGRAIYNDLMNNQRDVAIRAGRNADTTLPASQAAASDWLNDMGIPGIKYLDQGSRAAGEGSRNFVVFDDKTIEILRKYGILLPFAGAAMAGSQGQERQQ